MSVVEEHLSQMAGAEVDFRGSDSQHTILALNRKKPV